MPILKSITLVGVGPGDPSLITLAAIKAIEDSTVIAYPIAKEGAKSMAVQIASKWINNDQKQIPIVFPMVTAEESLQKAWSKASNLLSQEVLKGEKVSFLSQGDVSLFSTSSYLLLALGAKHPEFQIKLIPGVSSIAAAAAAGKWPLALQQEELLVAPTPEDPVKLEKLFQEATSSSRILILLKLGHRWPWVRSLLEDKGALKYSLFVQRVGFSDQIVLPADQVDDSIKPYFSLLLIRQKYPSVIS